MSKFIRSFDKSKHPNTITWLLEIIYLVAHKFKPEDSKLDKKLKYEYHSILNDLLYVASDIITDGFNIDYHESYGLHDLSFPPTIYELIKRYEWARL